MPPYKFTQLLPRNLDALSAFSSNITADDIVNIVGSIVAESSRQMDDSIQRTNDGDANVDEKQRTVVVVVTTNVYHINTEPSLGYEQSAKQQHTWLSFGNPMLMLFRDKINSVKHSDNGVLPAEHRNAVVATADADSLMHNNANENPIRDYILSNGIVKPIYYGSSNDSDSQ